VFGFCPACACCSTVFLLSTVLRGRDPMSVTSKACTSFIVLLPCYMSVDLLGVLVFHCPDAGTTEAQPSEGRKGKTAAGDSGCLYCKPFLSPSRSCAMLLIFLVFFILTIFQVACWDKSKYLHKILPQEREGIVT